MYMSDPTQPIRKKLREQLAEVLVAEQEAAAALPETSSGDLSIEKQYGRTLKKQTQLQKQARRPVPRRDGSFVATDRPNMGASSPSSESYGGAPREDQRESGEPSNIDAPEDEEWDADNEMNSEENSESEGADEENEDEQKGGGTDEKADESNEAEKKDANTDNEQSESEEKSGDEKPEEAGGGKTETEEAQKKTEKAESADDQPPAPANSDRANRQELHQTKKDDKAKADASTPSSAGKDGEKSQKDKNPADLLKGQIDTLKTAPSKKFLKQSWLNIFETFGLTLLYINFHFILAYVIKSPYFCKFGEEWLPAPLASGPVPTLKKRIPGLEIWEIIGMFLADCILALLLFLVVATIVIILYALAHPLDTFWELSKSLIGLPF
jgi:hypothetical protein